MGLVVRRWGKSTPGAHNGGSCVKQTTPSRWCCTSMAAALLRSIASVSAIRRPLPPTTITSITTTATAAAAAAGLTGTAGLTATTATAIPIAIAARWSSGSAATRSGRGRHSHLGEDILLAAYTARHAAGFPHHPRHTGRKMATPMPEGSAPGAAAAVAAAAPEPVIIDGKATADAIREELRVRVEEGTKAAGRAPGLAVVLVGSRPDSATYVRMKKKACAEIGITEYGRDLPEGVSQAELVAVVRELNAIPEVDGILIQLPLPAHIDENAVLQEVSFEKDVDGLHPLNVGSLVLKGRKPAAVPCTPKGCIELLKRYKVPIAGKTAVVLGRSNIVGIPVSMLLMQENATVTVCHSHTHDIPAIVGRADIVVAAIGRPNFVKGEWLKPGAAVIDVGINSVPDATKKSGTRLVGDVDYASAAVAGRAGFITPVPGGVGPMTIAMLLANTVESFERTTAAKRAAAAAGGAGTTA